MKWYVLRWKRRIRKGVEKVRKYVIKEMSLDSVICFRKITGVTGG